MITLFGKSNCQYTAKAIAALDAHGLSFVKKNISDPAVADELIGLGGKRQVPFIVDGETQMYESDAIVSYIEEQYGKGSEDKPRVHFAGGSCESGNCTG